MRTTPMARGDVQPGGAIIFRSSALRGLAVAVITMMIAGVPVPVHRVQADAPPPITWARQFGGSPNNQVYAISVDAQGNVFVAGATDGALPGQSSSGAKDPFVRRYDASGNALWTRQFGTGAESCAYAAAMDSQGNSYVAGYVYSALPGFTSAGNADAFVRKYDAAGAAMWTRQFGSSQFDAARALAIDGQGNIFVAGTAKGNLPPQTTSGTYDAFVRKYSSTGTVLWTSQFGTGSTKVEWAYGVAVDSAGAVYVAGSTDGAFTGQTSAGGEDAFVRKYDAAGAEVWTRQFGTGSADRANAVAVDITGSRISVAGYTSGTFTGQTSAGGQDVFVREYDETGAEVWTRQSGSGSSDAAESAAVDGLGNVYIGGITSGVMVSGGISFGYDDAFLRKYDSLGNPLWTRQLGTSAADYGEGVAVDGNGNPHVAGYTSGQGGFVRKYDGAGNETWARQINDGGSNDYGMGVAADGQGNVYVTGFTAGTLPGQSSAGMVDAFLRKYSSSGNELWTRQFGSPWSDYALGVAVDGTGNAYLCGYTIGELPGQRTAGFQDAFVVKYDGSGTWVWTRQFGTMYNDTAKKAALDVNGNLYVTGHTEGEFTGQTAAGNPGSTDTFVRKYDSSGNDLWTRQLGTAGSDWATGIAVDGTAGVWVAGYTVGTFTGQTSSGGQDAFVVKYDGSGSRVWLRQFGTMSNDSASGVAADGAGGFYVVGETLGTFTGQTSSGGQDAFIQKCDASGNATAMRQFGTSAGDTAFGAAVVGAGIYVGGKTGASPADGAVWVLDGLLNPVGIIPIQSAANDEVASVAGDGLGGLVFAGSTGGEPLGQPSMFLDDVFAATYDPAAGIPEDPNYREPPAVRTEKATEIGIRKARLNGYLESVGEHPGVDVHFDYSSEKDGVYGNPKSTLSTEMGSPAPFYANIGGLWPGHKYYFRAVAIPTDPWANDPVYGLVEEFTTAMPGDANEDEVVNSRDVTKVERVIAGVDAPTPGADANEDGTVDAVDITRTERIVAGLA